MSNRSTFDERVVGGCRTLTHEFVALDAFGLSVRLSKIVLPGLTALMKSGIKLDSMESIMKADIGILAAVAVNMLMHVTGHEAQDLARELLRNTTVVYKEERVELNTEQNINDVFTGRVGDMVKTLGFVVEVSFLSFFANKYRELKKEVKEEATPESQ